MKSQKTIWLSILVIGIWGTIGYKIFQGMESDDGVAAPPMTRKVHYTTESRDNYPLLLNYNDPFLKKPLARTMPVTERKVVVKPSVIQPVVPTVIINWEKVEYLGSIYNATRKSTIAYLRIDGVEYMGKQGEIVNDFKIENILKDSVQLSFSSQFKYIKKNK